MDLSHRHYNYSTRKFQQKILPLALLGLGWLTAKIWRGSCSERTEKNQMELPDDFPDDDWDCPGHRNLGRCQCSRQARSARYTRARDLQVHAGCLAFGSGKKVLLLALSCNSQQALTDCYCCGAASEDSPTPSPKSGKPKGKPTAAGRYAIP